MNKKFALLFCYLIGLLPGAGLSSFGETHDAVAILLFQTPFTKQNTGGNETNAEFNVLFATNEDCDFFINNESKGLLLKKEHLFVKLPAGSYTFRARSKSSGDELQQTIQVKEGALNEFFIDLLYFVDERKKERELLNTVNKTTKTGGTENSVVTNNKAATGREAEMAVINMLAVNMAPIKGGGFIMGNNKAPATDETEHPVTVGDILFGKYEVTQAQWEAIMG